MHLCQIPRADQRIDAADQIVDRQQADAAVTDRDPAVGRIVAVVAHHKQMAGRHAEFGNIVERIELLRFEEHMLVAARQRLDETRDGLCATRLPLPSSQGR